MKRRRWSLKNKGRGRQGMMGDGVGTLVKRENVGERFWKMHNRGGKWEGWRRQEAHVINWSNGGERDEHREMVSSSRGRVREKKR